MKELSFCLLYCCVNLLLQAISTSLLSSTVATGNSLSSNFVLSPSCENNQLSSPTCDPASDRNLEEKASCIERKEGSLWEFDESTLYLPIPANSCALETFPKDQDKKTYHSVYNASSFGVISKNGALHLYTDSVISASNSCQFVLELISYSSGGLGNVCKYYKYYNILASSQRNFQAHFRDECLVELNKDSVYDVTVTDSPTDISRIYRIFTPGQLYRDRVVPADPADWRTLLAVSLHYNYLTVYTQPIPYGHSYFLHITYTKGDEVQLEGSLARWLIAGSSAVTFNSAGDLTYKIVLKRCKKRALSSDQSEPTKADECSPIQQHQLVAPEISTREQETDVTSFMASTTASTEDVAVVKSDEGQLKKQDMYILVGTIIGVVVLAVVVLVVLFIYFKRRNGPQYGLTARFSGGNVYSDDILFEEDVKGAPPSILLLYSYDCQQHLACVQSLALLLQNSLGCSVMADFWATQEIAERGIYMWLQHKMATVNYIMVVCSTGARFKSVVNRRARLEQTADDAYLVAMRLLQSQSSSADNQKMVVYFDYSCESDVPVLLENWQRYKLLQDVQLLISTVVDEDVKGKGTKQSKDSPEKVYTQILKEKIESAKHFMDENPDWFHQNLHSGLSDEAPTASVPSTIPHPQQLPVVTVEYSRDGHRDMVRDEVDNKLVRNTIPRTISPPPTWNRKRAARVDPETQSSVGSYSSSLEDLEHDIDFMLNPSLPARAACCTRHSSLPSHARYVSSPQALIDMLPDGVVPSNGYYSSMLPPHIPQLKASVDCASQDKALCQES